MGSNWPLVKLGDFVQITTGHPFKSREYSEIAGVKLLRGDNIIQGALRWQNVKMLPKDKIGPKEQNYYLRTGDVILAMDRPWIEAGLKTAQINESDLPCLLVQRVACLRCENPTDQDFIRYIISSYDFVQYVKSIQTGTAIPHISGKQIKEFEFRLPPENIRKKIGEIIKQLDDKAHLNRQINQTLEQMAQALFKSWFVDFDPVVDNALDAGFFAQDLDLSDELLRRAEARQAARKQSDFKPLPDATRQLFPAAFEACTEPSLGLGGWVPKEWVVSELSELIDIKHGFAFKGEHFSDSETDEVLLTPGNVEIGGGFKPGKYKFYAGPIEEKYIFSSGDIFVTMTDLSKTSDTLGYPAIVPEINGKRFHHNQRLGKVIPMEHPASCSMFIYHTLCSTSYRQSVLGSSTGTTVKHTAPKKILSHKLVNSQNGLIEAEFERLIANYNLMVSANHKASRTLTKLRDTLLPKLISGELRLDNSAADLATE